MSIAFTKFTEMAYRSAIRTPRFPLFTHLSGKHARTARGRTYSAISPLLLPFSIQMLFPQTRHPASTHPKGPSQKSWETNGKSRAKSRVRVTQIENQNEPTNVERKVALRSAPRRVASARCGRRRVWGRVKRIGRKWACQRRRNQAGRNPWWGALTGRYIAMASTKAFRPRVPELAAQLPSRPKLEPTPPCTSSHGSPPTLDLFLTPKALHATFAVAPPYDGKADGSPQELGYPRSFE